MSVLEEIDATWNSAPDSAERLERGKILLAPMLRFEISESERRFLTSAYLRDKAKNISFRPSAGKLTGVCCDNADRAAMTAMLCRFRSQACSLARAMFGKYGESLSPGFTTFRPAEIAERKASWRHDDTRLHVDAFPSRPLQGRRILRIFSNVNPSAPRVWRAGDEFEMVASRFLPRVHRPVPGTSWLMARLRITKGKRTEYDHVMLEIHDAMKTDEGYQRGSPQEMLEIPPGATWACYTDVVPHAAMSGQFALEQTFHLPVDAMCEPARSPLHVLERMMGRKLV